MLQSPGSLTLGHPARSGGLSCSPTKGNSMFRRHLPAILAVVLLTALLVAYTQPSSSEEEKVSGEVIVATDTTAPGPTPEQLQLEKDVATITYAAAVHEHRLAVEWEAAAEAQRVFDAQAAEEARKERQAQAQQTQAQQTQARASAPAPSSGAGCVLPQDICDRESGHEGYGAVNPTGCSGRGCYGAYQFDPLTWNAVAQQMGRPDLVGNVAGASPADQDAVAAHLWNGGAGCAHWSACG